MKSHFMKMYLRVINPIVSMSVLMICIWAAVRDEGTFEFLGPWEGGIPSYFIAKGLFCSSVLFILGKILERLISCDGLSEPQQTDKDT